MHLRGARNETIAKHLQLSEPEVELFLDGEPPPEAAKTPRLVVVVERTTRKPPSYYPKGHAARCDSQMDISGWVQTSRNGVTRWEKP